MPDAASTRSETSASWRLPTIPDSSTTTTAPAGSPPAALVSHRNRVIVVEEIPVAVSNPAAARAARAVPIMGVAVWDARSPMMAMTVVLPVPATPTPTSMALPEVAHRRTIARWPSVRFGCAARAASILASGAVHRSAAIPFKARSMIRCSTVRSSAVV